MKKNIKSQLNPSGKTIKTFHTDRSDDRADAHRLFEEEDLSVPERRWDDVTIHSASLL